MRADLERKRDDFFKNLTNADKKEIQRLINKLKKAKKI